MNSITQVEIRISALEKELAQLRRHRNALTPFGRLPTEIIIRVFKHTQLDTVSDAEYARRTKGAMAIRPRYGNVDAELYEDPPRTEMVFELYCQGALLKRCRSSSVFFLFTCARLRYIGLDIPELWQAFSIPGNPNWRNLCLERSQGLLPIIEARCTEPDTESLDFITAHLPSTLELSFEIDGYRGEYRNRCTAALIQSCPQLQHLRLSGRAFDLTNLMLGGTSTNLVTLILDVGRLYALPELPNLRHFQMCGGFVEDHHTHGNVLTAVLLRMPKLEVLCLENVLVRPGDQMFMPNGITLPALRILRICTSATLTQYLLRILPPPSTGLDIQLQLDAIMNDDPHMFGIHVKSITDNITAFWKAKSQQHSLKPLSPSFTFRPDRMRLVLSSSPHFMPPDVSKPFCILDVPIMDNPPHINTVKTLHFVGDYTIPILAYDNWTPDADDGDSEWSDASSDTPYTDTYLNYDLVERTNPDAIILEKTSSLRYIAILIKWMRKRKDEGRPLRTLQIITPLNAAAEESLHGLVASFREHGTVKEIEWI
jgi:hypothetical protein